MRKIYFIFILFISGIASAQVNTMYYMENNPLRHHLNPAFQPMQRAYVDLPIVPSVYLNVSNNSLRLDDVIYPKRVDGVMQNVTFLHPEVGDIHKFYNRLHNCTTINSSTRTDLLQFGWKQKEGYLTFGVSQRVECYANVPKDLAKLGLFGTQDTVGINRHNLKRFGVKAEAFTEFAAGYSRKINDQWTVGGKAKILIGEANISARFSALQLDMGRDYWSIDMKGQANACLPGTTYETNDEQKLNKIDVDPDSWTDFINGYGTSFDLGVTYNPIEHLSVSASILDLGFIYWNKNVANIPLEGDYKFNGVVYDVTDRSTDWLEKYRDEIRDTIKYDASFNGYTSYLSAKILLGCEYGIVKDKIKFGLLSKTTIFDHRLLEDFTVSANFLPKSWFDFHLSYSIVGNQYSTIGAGMGARLGIFYFYFAADYIPTQYTSQGIPYSVKRTNAELGLLMTFGNRDKDHKKKKDEVEEETLTDENLGELAASTMMDAHPLDEDIESEEITDAAEGTEDVESAQNDEEETEASTTGKKKNKK